jgi:uncharacterized membrane protein
MNKRMIRNLSGPLLITMARNYIGNGKPLDFRFGVDLFKDRRVAVPHKMMAIVLGGVLIVALNAMELPLETLVALLLPVIGAGIDLAFNGVENVVGPLLLAALLLPHVAPKELVQRIRAERAGPIRVEEAAAR